MSNKIGFSYTLSKNLSRSDKYHLYKSEDGVFIISDKNIKFHNYSPSKYFPDIIIDIVALSERIPNLSYNKLSSEMKDKVESEALYFYKKYGHLGLEEMCFGNSTVNIFLDNTFDELGFYPINNEMYPIYDSNDIFIGYNDGTLTDGEPVWMFMEAIWYISCYSNFWYRLQTLKPKLNNKYLPTEKDNFTRLVSIYYLQGVFTNAFKDENGNYFIKDGNFKKNISDDEVIIYEDEYEGIYYKYPTWGEMLKLYERNVSLNICVDYDDTSNMEVSFSTLSLFEAICSYILFDASKKKSKEIKYCKNCNELILSENAKREYCSDRCRSQYGSRKHRAKQQHNEEGDNDE